MSIIYLAALKNFKSENQFVEKKYNYIVIKEHNYKLRKILRNQKQISVDLVKNYDLSNKYLLSFKVEENQSIGLKAYLDSKFEEFTKEINNINKESIRDFFKFLEADGLYDFEMLSSNDKLNEPSAPIKLPELLNEEVYPSSQNFLDTEQGFSSRSRSNSLSEEKTETESLRRTNSLPQLLVEDSNIKPIESSTSSLESLKNESPKLCNDQLAKAIQSVFFKENKTLLNINKHGLALQKGYFNGQEKSRHLSRISDLAEKIDLDSLNLFNSSSVVHIETLKNNINELDEYINDKQITDVLSRYRGFSPLRCFATLWGGGKVKSIEYVKQLQDQLDTLTQNISEIRLTA